MIKFTTAEDRSVSLISVGQSDYAAVCLQQRHARSTSDDLLTEITRVRSRLPVGQPPGAINRSDVAVSDQPNYPRHQSVLLGAPNIHPSGRTVKDRASHYLNNWI